MRYIDFTRIKPDDPEVKRWVRKASRKCTALSALTTHAERKAFLQRNSIWNDFKPILIRYFGEKCWYSECDLTGSFGDVDHFRPKLRSTAENNRAILDEGYWWLAYDYLNYRLSCEKCNRPFGDGGKRDCFPLRAGTMPAVFPRKDDISLLLDPCELQDVQLIDCDETGEIISLSNDAYEKMRIGISKHVYNWKLFNAARRMSRIKCKTALECFDLMYVSAPDKLGIPLAQIKELTDDLTPYSSFAKRYIKQRIEGKPYAEVLRAFVNT